MNELMLAVIPPLKEVLVQLLGIVVVIAAIAGLIYLIEKYVMKKDMPDEVKMFVGFVLIILIVIWGLNFLG